MEPEPKPVNRGWFYPIAIVNLLTNGTINEAEFVLLGLINELCNPSCTASNSYLAEKWGKSRRWVEETISKFRELGLVKAHYEKEANGLTSRWIKVTFAGDEQTTEGTTEENFGGYRRKLRQTTEENFGQSNKEQVTKARRADASPGVCDSSPSFGLSEKAQTLAEQYAQKFSDWTVKNKLHVGKRGSYRNGWTPRTMSNWAKACRELFQQEDPATVKRTLIWYFAHWRDDYVPQCHTMRKFCERFVDVYRKMEPEQRNGERKRKVAGVTIVNGVKTVHYEREEGEE